MIQDPFEFEDTPAEEPATERIFDRIVEKPLKAKRDINYPMLGGILLASAAAIGGVVVGAQKFSGYLDERAAAQAIADAEAAKKAQEDAEKQRQHELALAAANARDAIAAARSDATAAIGSLTQAQQALATEREQRERAESEAASLQKRQTLVAQAYRDALEISRCHPAEVATRIENKVRPVTEREGEEWAQVYEDALRTNEHAMRTNLSQLADSLDQVFQGRLREAKDDATRAAMIAENELGIAPEVITNFNEHTLLNESGEDSCTLQEGALSGPRCTVFSQFRNAAEGGTLSVMYDNNGNPWPNITQSQADRFVGAMVRQFGTKINTATMQRFAAGIMDALARGDARTNSPQQRR